MFANAVTSASEFTRPILISNRQQSGRIETSCGTYILVNSDGWILTAGHVVGALIKCNQDKPKYDQYLATRAAIESNAALSKGNKKQQLRALKCNREWMTNVSYWWDVMMSQPAHGTSMELQIWQLFS